MSSRLTLKHTVSTVAPATAQVGDEWFNPSTNVLYKATVVSGTTVSWNIIPVAISGNINLGPVTSVKITGGSNGQAVTTDGNGNLSFNNNYGTLHPFIFLGI